MSPQSTLIELLERLNATSGNAIFVSDYEMIQWTNEAVKAIKSHQLISKAKISTSAICLNCERQCVMPVHTLQPLKGEPQSFIICDKRSDTNRVVVSTNQLIQWQCTIEYVRKFIANILGLRLSNIKSDIPNQWNIGIVKGSKNSQMLGLKIDYSLSLVVGDRSLLLADCVEYDGSAYSLDVALIRQLIDSVPSVENHYTPSTVRREARKLDTEDRNKKWAQAYRELKKNNPNKSDTWCSKQIKKTEISDGCSSETIRKQMKNFK